MSSSRTDPRSEGAGNAPDAPTVADVTMPQMGVSVAEGAVVEWHKHPGDWVEADETICEISTDKIDSDVPSPATGRVTEILVEAGSTVDVGTVLARIATDALPGEPHSAACARRRSRLGEHVEGPEPAAAGPRVSDERPRRYSPVVLRIAAEHHVNLDNVEGTGRGGRVRKQDVLAYIDAGGNGEPPMHIESPYSPDPGPAAGAPRPDPEIPQDAERGTKGSTHRIPQGDRETPGSGQPLSRIRQSIGEHMLRSLQTAAHCTTIVEADMSRIEAARAGLGLTYLPFVARAVVDALRRYPALNATLEGGTFTVHPDVNLGVAVSLGEDGLIVPVVRRAQVLSAEGLGARIKELARRARENELTPDDVRGGTFTITNPGAFGAIAATPIINQPQVAILDLEAVVKRPVVVTGPDGDDVIAIRPMTNLCMSWDHRALDGALAAQFLSAVKRGLEDWSGG